MVNNGSDQHGSQVTTSPSLDHRSSTRWFSLWWPGQARLPAVSWFIQVLFHSCPQFLITTGENLDYLNGVHTVFGEVSEGLDVLAKINETFVDNDFIPLQDVRLVRRRYSGADSGCDQTRHLNWCLCRINHTVILEDPFDDPPDLPVPDRSPEPTREQLDVSVAPLTWTHTGLMG